MSGDKALDALLEEHQEHLTVLPDGRVQCELNGHTMPPRLDVVRAFVRGSKYQRLARQAEADASLDKYAPFIVPSANFPSMLYCALTGQAIERSLEAVRRHLRGKRWAGAKARFAADKQELRPEPSLSEFGVYLEGEERGRDKKKKGGRGGSEDEDVSEGSSGSGDGESGSGSGSEEEMASGSGSGDEDEDEESEEEEEEEAPAPAARGKGGGKSAAAAAAAGKKPARTAKTPSKPAAAAERPEKKVSAKRGAAGLGKTAPAPAEGLKTKTSSGAAKRNPTRPSKAKKVRA